jgi:hypothetical protein
MLIAHADGHLCSADVKEAEVLCRKSYSPQV